MKVATINTNRGTIRLQLHDDKAPRTVANFEKLVKQGFYNNLNDESEQKTWGNYGSNYPRLVELKNKYDPGNLFRLNANIKPG